LFWMHKYGNDDREDLLKVDIRSLYRHEHIEPVKIIKNLYRLIEDDNPQEDLFGTLDSSFRDMIERDDLEKVAGYYSQHDGWKNRLIQGDSHLVNGEFTRTRRNGGKGADDLYGPALRHQVRIELADKT